MSLSGYREKMLIKWFSSRRKAVKWIVKNQSRITAYKAAELPDGRSWVQYEVSNQSHQEGD